MIKKRTLIITYYWPPSGGPGVQRWLKFVKYLPEFNVEPIVYIPENPNYPLIDTSLEKEVSKDVIILNQPIKEPYKLAKFFSKSSQTISRGIISKQNKQSLSEKLMLYIRGNFYIPDARIAWVKPSVAFLTDYILKENIDTIITTGPPHSIHLIGLELKKKLDKRWIADFRDPWTTIGYHKQLKLTESSKEKHKRLESEVLNLADQIIVTSLITKREFQNITNKPIEVITNGYDKESLDKVVLDEKFTLSHIGSLLSERNPEVFWQVLEDLTNEYHDFSAAFQFNLVGAVSENVLKSIELFNLTNYTNRVGYIPHKESVMFQKKSQLLLLIEIDSDDTKSIIPGKLFEYMASNRPIIAIGPKDSDVETIIKETNTGKYFYYDDYKSLKNVILDYFREYQNKSLVSHAIGLQKYSRRVLSKKLAELI